MLVVPIVFASIICGLFGLKDFSSLGRISLKTITVYLITTSLAISLALLVSYFIQPGLGTEIKYQTGDFSIGEKTVSFRSTIKYNSHKILLRR